MTDSRPPGVPPVSLRTVALVSLLGGASAAAATVFALRAVGVPAPPAVASEPVPETVADTRTPEGSDGSALASVPDGFGALSGALETAEAERSQLAGSLLALNRRAEALEARLSELADDVRRGAQAGSGSVDSPFTGEVGGGSVGGERDATLADESSEPVGPAPDSLVAAGLDPASAADIRRRRDEFQLARLELIDQATREGWADSDRLGDSLEALEGRRPDLREELGDEAYDRYLHEEGSRNRVGIASVISGSAADMAGLVPGDIVLSYAGSRLFRSGELQAATREGERGEYVQLGVLRDGEIVAVDVPRGPLGVTLEGLRRPPG